LVLSVSQLALSHGGEHESEPSATYLGNEGVLVSSDKGKVLFDPFFHNAYDSYQLVPESIRRQIFAGEAPYDEVDVIVISHAHGDHFSAEDSLNYLLKHKSAKLLAPQQAIAMIEAIEGSSAVRAQLIGIELVLGDEPIKTSVGKIDIESVRIPHAGWPSRKGISNLVHRVSFEGNFSVIHMGDADPNDIHFKPFKAH